METNKIYNGDAYELIKQIPDNSIDLIVTDPPYIVSGNGKGFLDRKMYQELQDADIVKGINVDILYEFKRIMKKINMYIYCSVKQLYSYLKFAEDNGYNYNVLTWHKTNPIPACNNTYLSDTEYIVFIRKPGVPLNNDDISRKNQYFITSVNKNDKLHYKHPTIKPLVNITTHILNSSGPGDIVFDPFLGSGTTAVAAKELNRKYIGFEIDKEFYNIAQNRINGINAQGQTSIFTDFNLFGDDNA